MWASVAKLHLVRDADSVYCVKVSRGVVPRQCKESQMFHLIRKIRHTRKVNQLIDLTTQEILLRDELEDLRKKEREILDRIIANNEKRKAEDKARRMAQFGMTLQSDGTWK